MSEVADNRVVLYPSRVEKVMHIGPEMARRIKEQSKGRNYRNLDRDWARLLADEFLAGRYEMKEEPLKFDEFGVLHDGQHRIEAIIMCGMTLTFRCVFGVPPQASEGWIKARSNGDRLAHHGFTNVNALAAAARLVACWQKGDICLTGRVSPAATEKVVFENPELANFIKMAVHNRHKAVSASTIAAVGYISCHLAGNDWPFSAFESFVDQICNGIDLGKDSPTRLLRERLQAVKDAKSKLRARFCMALVIKAWNAHVLGTPLRSLRWCPDGTRAEPFPEIA